MRSCAAGKITFDGAETPLFLFIANEVNIAIIGAGYVGLAAGACFAKTGHTVCCMDIDSTRIEMLNAGRSPIFEPGLEPLLKSGIDAGRLSFTSRYSTAVCTADAVFLTVGTPALDDTRADTSALFAAIEQVGALIESYTLVVIKSTVPIGTHRTASQLLAKHCKPEHFDVVTNPEFLRAGSAVHDFLQPDRVVVGTANEKSRTLMDEIYRDYIERNIDIFHTNKGNAELIKYASNSLLAARITFINEIADLCEVLSLDITEVVKGIGLDHRIGNSFMQAGPGFGGSCFPKDSLELLSLSQARRSPLTILQAVLKANQRRQKILTKKITDAIDAGENRTVGILGVTFKEGTCDMRNSFSLSLIPALLRAGLAIKAYDPQGMEQAQTLMPDVEWCPNPYAAAADSDMLIIHTKWPQFQELDWRRIQGQMRRACIYDLRNCFAPADMQALGFDYISIGRAAVRQSPVPGTGPA